MKYRPEHMSWGMRFMLTVVAAGNVVILTGGLLLGLRFAGVL